MANEEHLDLLKQGVGQWNAWRREHPEIRPDLSGANLYRANLRDASLYGADLHNADLSGANLNWTDLCDARLSRATLRDATLRDATLYRADLRDASLYGADLHGASLFEADLRGAELAYTIIARVSLRTTKGLTTIRHSGPSSVVLHTVQLPQDGSALHFLRGCGVPDEWIDFYRAQMMHPIQYHSCFISYSGKDETLARRLHADLQARGVRCWFAPEDLKIGDRFRVRIDEAIHVQDKLLLILSEYSIESDWVEVEVESALHKEKHQKREVLFPVRIDESVLTTERAWAKHLRFIRHIGNFTNWTDPQAYQQAFERLLRDLKKESR